MAGKNFTTTLLVSQTPTEAFDAINNVRGWWSEGVEGATRKLNDEFIYRHKDMHFSKQKLIEVIPGKKVVWLVTDSYLSFLKKEKSEWNDTKIIFEINEKDNQTEVVVTHQGLIPGVECFEACSNGWNYYLNSLVNLITTGNGQPNKMKATINV